MGSCVLVFEPLQGFKTEKEGWGSRGGVWSLRGYRNRRGETVVLTVCD